MALTLTLAAQAGAESVEVAATEELPDRVIALEITTPDGAAKSGPPTGMVELIALDGEGSSLGVAVRGAGPHRATAPPGSIWQVRPSVPGYWGAQTTVTAGGDPELVALYPVGELRGEVEVPRGTSPPDLLRLLFEAPLRVRVLGKPRPKGTIECPVEKTAWACSLPAGVHDLQVQASGFASTLLWDVPVAEGEALSVATLALVPGAAVLGRVEVDGTMPEGEIEVELRPAGARCRDRFGAERLAHLFHRAHPDERGYFQFRGLRSGTYRVEATAEGRAPAVRKPIEVLEGRETQVDPPLLLLPPTELSVFLEPHTAPDGEQWTVTLKGLDGSGEGVHAIADWMGVALLDGLAPGRYRLMVRSGVSNWLIQEVEVADDRSNVHLEIPVVPVAGEVLRDGEPTRARIIFGGAPPRDVEVTVYSDHEGAFTGHLPGEGEWPVAVVLDPGGGKQVLEPVVIERNPGEEEARVTLELADTVAAGRVVDAEGLAVASANVLARREGSRGGRSRTTSDSRGRFRFRSLPPGDWQIEAFSRDATGRTRVEIREGEAAEIEIRLSATRRFRGRVRSPTGPVAAAAVYVIPEVARSHPLAPVRTGPHGAFDDEVPADAVGVHLLVLPPGRGARLLFFPLTPEGDPPEVEVAVGELTGTLQLTLPPPGSGLVTLGRGPARAPVRLLDVWARFHGVQVDRTGSWTVPGMESGPYELCSAGRCARGVLAPGGRLELSLPDDEDDPEAADAAGSR